MWRQLNEGLFKLESLSLFSIERTLNALVLPATKWNKNNISFNNSSNNKSTRANTEKRGLSYIQIGISLVRDIDLFVNKNPTIHQMHDPTKRKGESKVHSFFKKCFARSSFDTICGYFQLIF